VALQALHASRRDWHAAYDARFMKWPTSFTPPRGLRRAFELVFAQHLGQQLSAWMGASCVLCGTPGGETCDECNASVEAREAGRLRCRTCADSFENTGTRTACNRCLQDPPAFSRTICAGDYAPPLDAVERGLKFQARTHAARALATWLANATRRAGREQLPDLLIPVPLASERLAQRGFNQAALIARCLADELDINVRMNALRRVRETPALSLMHAEERTHAIRGAFACVEDLSGRAIGLVDDVMTTGATLRAAAKALRSAGARDVIVLVALRTPAP
jgi:ComF family protein